VRTLAAGEEPAYIGFDEADAHSPEAVWLSRHFPRERRPLRASNQFAQGIAARSGVGVALLPLYIDRGESSLQRCDLGPVPAPREVFVVRRRQNARTMPINVVVDYLVNVFKGDRAIFEDRLD
jgi:DNA-binding transcriptional LysR family regulator